MNSFDLIRMGLGNLKRRKLRTFLTVLSVIIGCTSIIVMMSITIGLQKQSMEWIESMGSLTTITVYKNYGGYMDDGTQDKDKEIDLDDEHFKKILELPHVVGAAKTLSVNPTIKNGKLKYGGEVLGVESDYFELFVNNISEGEAPTSSTKDFFILGGRAYNTFYDDNARSHKEPNPIELHKKLSMSTNNPWEYHEPSLGEAVGIKKEKKYKPLVSGILESERYDNNSYSIFIPVEQALEIKKIQDENQASIDNTEAKSRKKKKIFYETFYVKADDFNNVPQISENIKDMGFRPQDTASMRDDMNEHTRGIRYTLIGIGSVSLFVAALGIANTMVMSLYERRKEIGVMKVIGASVEDILNLFLIEAAGIGFIGGTIGVIASKIISIIINHIASGTFGYGGSSNDTSIIPFWLYFLGIGFSMLIGVISGFLPAIKATKLSALEAIRTE